VSEQEVTGYTPSKVGVPGVIYPSVSGTISAMVECPRCERWAYLREPAKTWPNGVHVEKPWECRCGEKFTVSVVVTKEEPKQ